MTVQKPTMRNIKQEHVSIHDLVDSFRKYYAEESAYINSLAKNGDEHDKKVAREISRVIDNLDRICRIAESYAEKHGIPREDR